VGQVSVRYETLIYLSASGTVTSAQTAFGVSLQNYTHDGGQTVQAPSTDASVPNSVGNAILAVGGLDTTKNAAHVGAPIPPPDAFANARPCSIYYGQIAAKYQADFTTKLPKFQGATLPYAPCGYTGPQFRAAYENNSALDGSGVTVASTLWYNSSTIRSDINTYATNHGDRTVAAVHGWPPGLAEPDDLRPVRGPNVHGYQGHAPGRGQCPGRLREWCRCDGWSGVQRPHVQPGFQPADRARLG
jgi:Pro-kumamolisin, activation domain